MRRDITHTNIVIVSITLSVTCATLGVFSVFAVYLQTSALYWLLVLTGIALSAALVSLVLWMSQARKASAFTAFLSNQRAEVDKLRQLVAIFRRELELEVRFDEGARNNFRDILSLLLDFSTLANLEPMLDSASSTYPEIKHARILQENIQRSLQRAYALLSDRDIVAREALTRAHEDVLSIESLLQDLQETIATPIQLSETQSANKEMRGELHKECREWLQKLEVAKTARSGAGMCEASRMVLSISSMQRMYFPEDVSSDMIGDTLLLLKDTVSKLEEIAPQEIERDPLHTIYLKNTRERLNNLKHLTSQWFPGEDESHQNKGKFK